MGQRLATEQVVAVGDASGVAFERHFTQAGIEPFDAVEWVRRDAVILGGDGEPVFEQRGVEVPAFWSETATKVVASKYFRGSMGAPDRERSVRQLIGRVVETITAWGRADGYFASEDDAATFRAELQYLLLHQRASFNSPVWFNVGVDPRPQCSACFINGVEDDMAAILELAKTEALLFQKGSGAGSNLSSLRGSMEELSGGGRASGPVSFMRGFDAFAGVIKSGGRTRRAAKMVVLDVDHPDIVEFIEAKTREEAKALALVAAGYPADFDDAEGAYGSVFFQNANHSVRLPDAFLEAVEAGAVWSTHAVTDGRPVGEYDAADLLRRIARAAWSCGDPGVQYDTTINAWHTCPETGRIRASNPCSEFLFLDDSACNLVSLNLLRFYDAGAVDGAEDGFDVEGFRHACEVLITAQDILVDRAGYPTAKIEQNSHDYRPLGLGYANLGALLMARGVPYDSDAGRAWAGALTALLTGAAYRQSARLAATRGAFAGFAKNRAATLGVLAKHHQALADLDGALAPSVVLVAAETAWRQALVLARESGVRNAQATALAPTGTIAFMMDCATTGIEPELALVKEKRLVGGGALRIVNTTVPAALERLGYGPEAVTALVAYVEEHGTLEGAPDLHGEHLPVFDCALPTGGGHRTIHYRGHLMMVAAVQPFISGAISKTINLPREATPEAIFDLYLEGWHRGLKAVAVYRDGCKGSQPLSAGQGEGTATPPREQYRHRLPAERPAITHKFSIDQHKGYVTVGLYDDGQPGEIFIVMAKEGSTISGLMDAFATTVSIALQSGVPLKTLVSKFAHMRFEPAGFTGNPQVPYAKSIVDYIFRWLAAKFLRPEEQHAVGVILDAEPTESSSPVVAPPGKEQSDAPACADCGSIMVRSGACYGCPNCGATSGCG
jgi:ribonucleoside-diphosphate reductase alpha chain